MLKPKATARRECRDSWRTPEWLHEALDKEFGFDDFDPCPFQPDWTPEVHQNGLDLDWNGKRVFCNPPYSRGSIKPWVEKAFASAALTVFLLPAWTATDWFHMLRDRGAEIRFFRHRVNFIPHQGIKPSSNRDGSIVAIVRNFARPTPQPRVRQPQRTSQRIEPISVALYPGAKQWFIQNAAEFFRARPCRTLVEPFAGSGVVGFSLLYAGIIEHLVLVEKRPEIALMLQGIVNDPTLADRYAGFQCTRANVQELLRSEHSAFRYLVQTRCRNRARFDGGLRSSIDARYCPKMVVENIRRVQAIRQRITVIQGDAFDVMPWYAGNRDTGCYSDPPFSADPRSKGRTVYLHHKLNHQKLFSLLADWRGSWLLTEDNTRTVRRLALCYRFATKRFPMNTSDNKRKHELVIWRKRKAF